MPPDWHLDVGEHAGLSRRGWRMQSNLVGAGLLVEIRIDITTRPLNRSPGYASSVMAAIRTPDTSFSCVGLDPGGGQIGELVGFVRRRDPGAKNLLDDESTGGRSKDDRLRRLTRLVRRHGVRREIPTAPPALGAS